VLGVTEGASENEVVVKSLLEELVERGIKPDRKRLYVIDGSKALRAGINAVYGNDNPVQRCRNHKLCNVTDKLTGETKDQALKTMRAAYKLAPEEGMSRLKKLAEWLDHERPDAAKSLREGMEETFTVNRLGLTKWLCRCLSTTNLIENPYSGVRRMSKRVTNWQNGAMALRWTASSLLAVEKKFKKIMGYQDLWMLKAILDEGKNEKVDKKVDAKSEVA